MQLKQQTTGNILVDYDFEYIHIVHRESNKALYAFKIEPDQWATKIYIYSDHDDMRLKHLSTVFYIVKQLFSRLTNDELNMLIGIFKDIDKVNKEPRVGYR